MYVWNEGGKAHHTFSFVRPQMTSHFNLISFDQNFFRPIFFYSFFKYFKSFHSNFQPRHVVYKGLKYSFLLFFNQNILWRYNRRKTIQDIFISSLSQENQTHLLAMLLVKNMFIFSCRLLNTRPVTYHLKVTVQE